MNRILLVPCPHCQRDNEVHAECEGAATPVYRVFKGNTLPPGMPYYSGRQRKLTRKCSFCDEQMTITIEDC